MNWPSPRRLAPLLLFALLALPYLLLAQQTEDWAGNWDGTLKIPGTELDMQLELTPTDTGWVGQLDIPQQLAKDLELSELTISEERLSFQLPGVPGQAGFEGSWKDGRIVGTFSQGGQALDLSFDKRDAAARAELLARVEQIKTLVDSFRQGAEVPGLGLGIFYQDEVLLAEGFGWRNREKEIPVTADTRFAIGSSSKAFTSMGLGLLADAGLLKWNEPVRTYLPDFQLYDEFATQEMTPVDLLCHRSGLPRHDFLWYATNFSRQDLYQRLKYLEPSASFRTSWQYQNLMFMTAGILTERLSGQSWEEYIQENIFQPLGMTSANFSVTAMAETDDFSYGYGEKADSITRLPFHPIEQVGPAGSINASTNNMLRWVELQLGDGQFRGQHIVNQATLRKMHQPHMIMEQTLTSHPAMAYPSYGLGWFIYDYDGLRIVEHGGNIDGFSALVFMIPEEGLGLVTLTNKNGSGLGHLLAYTITDMLLDREPGDWYGEAFGQDDDNEEEEETEEVKEETISTPAPHALEAYPGTYTHPGYGDLVIEQVGDQLKATYYHFSSILEHRQFDFWAGETEDVMAIDTRFETDRNGQITALYSALELSLPELRFERQPDDKLSDPDFLTTLCGKYELEGGIEIEISLEDTQLQMKVTGQPTYNLSPKQGNFFTLADYETIAIEFLFEDGKVAGLVSHQPNGDFRADKME